MEPATFWNSVRGLRSYAPVSQLRRPPNTRAVVHGSNNWRRGALMESHSQVRRGTGISRARFPWKHTTTEMIILSGIVDSGRISIDHRCVNPTLYTDRFQLSTCFVIIVGEVMLWSEFLQTPTTGTHLSYRLRESALYSFAIWSLSLECLFVQLE